MPRLGNPFDRLKIGNATRRERRVSDEELTAILDVSNSVVLAAAIRLAVETTMRRGELCGLTWPMISLDSHVVHLPGTITKNGRRRDVPLSPAAVGCLSELKYGINRPSGLVLDVTPHAITRAMERTISRARRAYLDGCAMKSVEPDPRFCVDVHFHDLRHESTSRLTSIFALHELMKIVGHSSSAMLARYYHPSAVDFAKRMRESRK